MVANLVSVPCFLRHRKAENEKLKPKRVNRKTFFVEDVINKM